MARLSANGRRVEAGDVWLASDRYTSLAGISLEARAGELLAVLGPPNSGKTGLLRVLGGVAAPDSGLVRIAGRDVGALRTRELEQLRALTSQPLVPAASSTVGEVVLRGRTPFGRPSARDEEVVASALAATETVAIAGRRYAKLPADRQADVRLARMLAHRAALLLLDEPTGGLTERKRDQVMAVIRHRTRDGDTAVLAMTDPALAAHYADQVVLLENGSVRANGAPGEVLTPEVLDRLVAGTRARRHGRQRRRPPHAAQAPGDGRPGFLLSHGKRAHLA